MRSLFVFRDGAGWIDCVSAFTRRTRIIYCQSINLALQRAYPGVYAKTATVPRLSRSELIGQGGIFLVRAHWHAPQENAQLLYVTCAARSASERAFSDVAGTGIIPLVANFYRAGVSRT